MSLTNEFEVEVPDENFRKLYLAVFEIARKHTGKPRGWFGDLIVDGRFLHRKWGSSQVLEGQTRWRFTNYRPIMIKLGLLVPLDEHNQPIQKKFHGYAAPAKWLIRRAIFRTLPKNRRPLD